VLLVPGGTKNPFCFDEKMETLKDIKSPEQHVHTQEEKAIACFWRGKNTIEIPQRKSL